MFDFFTRNDERSIPRNDFFSEFGIKVMKIFYSLVVALNPLAVITPPFLQVAIFPLIENSLSDNPQSAYIPDDPPLFIGDPLELKLEPCMGYIM